MILLYFSNLSLIPLACQQIFYSIVSFSHILTDFYAFFLKSATDTMY